MIYADDVSELKITPYSFLPPSEIVFLMPLPVVNRISPELTGRGEAVWWYSGDSTVMPICVGFEEFQM